MLGLARNVSLCPHRSSTVHSRSSCRRAIQQKRRSSRTPNLRTRQMHRWGRNGYRSRLQTPLSVRWSRRFLNGRLILASGALLAIDGWGYLAHPSSTRDDVAGVFVDRDHGLALRADVFGIDSIAPEMPFLQLLVKSARNL